MLLRQLRSVLPWAGGGGPGSRPGFIAAPCGKFRFDVRVASLERLPAGVAPRHFAGALRIAWCRGNKSRCTRPAALDQANGRVQWDEALTQNATIYLHKEPRGNAFKPKEFELKLQAVYRKGNRDRVVTLGVGKIDMANFTSLNYSSRDVDVPIQLKATNRAEAVLHLNVACTWIRNEMRDEDMMTDVSRLTSLSHQGSGSDSLTLSFAHDPSEQNLSGFEPPPTVPELSRLSFDRSVATMHHEDSGSGTPAEALRRTEEALAKTLAEKERLKHDIRNPVQVMLLCVDASVDGAPGGSGRTLSEEAEEVGVAGAGQGSGIRGAVELGFLQGRVKELTELLGAMRERQEALVEQVASCSAASKAAADSLDSLDSTSVMRLVALAQQIGGLDEEGIRARLVLSETELISEQERARVAVARASTLEAELTEVRAARDELRNSLIQAKVSLSEMSTENVMMREKLARDKHLQEQLADKVTKLEAAYWTQSQASEPLEAVAEEGEYEGEGEGEGDDGAAQQERQGQQEEEQQQEQQDENGDGARPSGDGASVGGEGCTV